MKYTQTLYYVNNNLHFLVSPSSKYLALGSIHETDSILKIIFSYSSMSSSIKYFISKWRQSFCFISNLICDLVRQMIMEQNKISQKRLRIFS